MGLMVGLAISGAVLTVGEVSVGLKTFHKAKLEP